MTPEDWSDPRHVLAAALTVLRAPLDQTLPRLSDVLAEVLPHRAVAMLTGDCVRSPVVTHGEPGLTEAVTASELARLAGTVDIGRPWFGDAALAGASRPVLAVASAPPGSAGALLAVVPAGAGAPSAAQRELAQRLWDLTTVHVIDLLSEAEPVYLAESRVAASERARTIADLTEAHAATLTALLGPLRARGLDDATARRTATDLAVSALIELRAVGDRDRAVSEEPADEAFARLADKLSLLTRYSDVAIELVGPQRRRSLPADVAKAARATVRGAVLTMLEQGGVDRIRIAWHVEDTELRVTVRDDGPGTLAADALAVHRLAERLAQLGGTLAVDAVPGWGTTVSASLPLVAPEVRDAHPLTRLNRRELDVLEQLTHGHRNRQIAEHLHISEHTVKFHVANILDKLGVRSRGEAAATARNAGFTPN
jgi:DNA-binding CsgD family transcriptional regulator